MTSESINVKHVGDHDFIENYKGFTPRFSWPRKKALLCYLTIPLIAHERGEEIVRFSNSGIVLSWIRVLNELGYVVDVMDWDDRTLVPKKSYALVVFHGGKNFKTIYPSLANRPRVIHFLTGSYWRFNNLNEDKRIADFKRRHGIKLDRDRYIHDPEDPVNEVSEGIIVLGDPSMRSTYPNNLKVLTINNASYPDSHFDKTKKNYDRARNNFLFFAGSGNVHKGLDLLIDAFKDLEENLYIVTVLDKKVMAVFKKELKLPNIHAVGEVDMRSPEFYEIMDKCAFVILPSCSEGQAGSVVEAMNQGLIPIVSKETRLDASSYGVVLENNKIPTIKKQVRKLAKTDPATIEKMARKTRATAIKDHNPKKFRKDLKAAIKKILSQ